MKITVFRYIIADAIYQIESKSTCVAVILKITASQYFNHIA